MARLPTSEAQRVELGNRIEELRRSSGLTFEGLAEKSGYDESTIRNITKGKSTKAKTLIEVCKAVGLDLDSHKEFMEVADEPHGGYTKKSFAKYVGTYNHFRWSYNDKFFVLSSLFYLDWSETRGCMTFREEQKYIDLKGRAVDFSQVGDIYSGDSSGLLHLATIDQGTIRLITVTKMSFPDLLMRGCVLTQSRAGLHRPAISPVFFKKQADTTDFAFSVGELPPGSPRHSEIAAELHAIEQDIVKSTFGMGVMPTQPERGRRLSVKPVPAIVASENHSHRSG